MHRKSYILLVLLLLIVTTLTPGASLRAQTDGSDEELPAPEVTSNFLQAGDGRTAVLVQLQNNQPQNPVAAQLAGIGAQELYRSRLIFNGIAVLVDPQNLDAIRALAGVTSVRPILAKEVLDTFTDARGGVDARVFPSGATGQGVTIGVIDSGIDYTHATFGGAGTARAYNSNNPNVVEAGTFPTAKVVGGYDFAGNTYDAVDNPIPAPDGDPLDCSGRGTHVASTVAGFGVANGATYPGPYNQSVNSRTFNVAPGVAPQGQLYALKVLGCETSRTTTLLVPAIERALDPNGDGNTNDRLDVLVISLGAPFGSPSDPDYAAVQAAVAAGMVVVVGAGNIGTPTNPDSFQDGSSFYAAASPGSVPQALSVAALNTTGGGSGLTLLSNLGPQGSNLAVKPDLGAPGVNIRAAAAGSGTGAAASSGTASAAAHVAGGAALLQQLRPGWSPVQVKAALMNTATPFQTNAGFYSLTRSGIGQLAIARAAATPVLAYNSTTSGVVSLYYGAPRVADVFERDLELTIENVSAQPQNVTIGLDAGTGGTVPGIVNPGVALTPDTTTATIPAGQSVVVNVQAQVDAGALTLRRDPVIPLRQTSVARHYLDEQSGALAISVGAQDTVRVPYMLAAKTASRARVSQRSLEVPGGIGVALANITNRGERNSTNDRNNRPLLSAFELTHISPNEPSSAGSANVVDMQYVGIASNFNVVDQNISDTSVFFGLATYDAWATPNQIRFEILIDSNKDGTFDYILVNSNLGEITPLVGNPNDVLLATLLRAPATPQASPELIISSFLNRFSAPLNNSGQDTAPFNSRVMFLGASANRIGLTAGQTSFNYVVRSYYRDTLNFGGVRLIDETPLLTFDAARPAIDTINPRDLPGVEGLSQTPMYLASNRSPIFVRIQGNLIPSSEQSGLLVLFHHNQVESQAEVVPVATGFVDPVNVFSIIGEQNENE